MKKSLAAVALMAFAGLACAQASNNSALQANSTLQTDATALNQGNNLTNNFISPSDSKQTIKSAPSIGTGSYSGSFSSDYCMGTAQGGLSVLGGAITGGGPVRDAECSLRRNFERIQQAAATAQTTDLRGRLQQASVDVLCSIDPVTRAALEGQGLCTVKTMETIAAQSDRRTPQAQNSLYSGS